MKVGIAGASWVRGWIVDTHMSIQYEFQPPGFSHFDAIAVTTLRMQDAVMGVDRALEAC